MRTAINSYPGSLGRAYAVIIALAQEEEEAHPPAPMANQLSTLATAAHLAADLGAFYLDRAYECLDNEPEFKRWFWLAVNCWAIEQRLAGQQETPIHPVAEQFAAIIQDDSTPVVFDADYRKLLNLYQDEGYDD